MASKKKLLQAAAGSAGGAGLDVDEVFSTYLWDGNGSTRTITNGIDLDGEGGLVWYKGRDTGGLGASQRHSLYDTERGATKRLRSDSTSAEQTESTALTAFNSNGFTIGGDAETNQSNYDYASWTFREAPKFFDVVSIDVPDPEPTTITVNHNLGQQVGMVLIKPYLHAYPWYVWHRSIGANNHLELNTTAAQSSFGGTGFSSTSTTITIPGSFVHSGSSNGKCILYLFAHNDSDGEFGPDGDADIIKCGSFTEVSGSDVKVTLGFEPQWIMIKVTSTTGDWGMYDVMRGWTSGNDDFALSANTTSAESNVGDRWLIHPDGFTWKNTSNTRDIAYMAIRRGPLAAPESGTEVFALDDSSTTDIGGYTLNSNFPVDFYFFKNKNGGDSISIPRLTVGDLRFNQTFAEEDRSSVMNFDSNTGVTRTTFQGGIDSVDYAFRRAPNFFDVVTYTGTGSATTVSHNLGVAPEMMWVRRRNDTANWFVYHSGLTSAAYRLFLNGTNPEGSVSGAFNSTAPTASVFTVGDSGSTNASGEPHIAHLFATAAGVSKVGSFTGTGSDINIDCGFSSGARFILCKRTDSTSPWWVFDTVRGIVAGNDTILELNSTNAEYTSYDFIDPLSSGFTVTGSFSNWNANGASYIFYAIA